MTRTFCDNLGREWKVEADAVTIARLRQALGIDLSAERLTAERLQRLVRRLANRQGIAALLELLLRPQWHARGLTDEEFVAGLRGGVEKGNPIDRALAAFFNTLVDKVPQRSERQRLRALILQQFGS